MDIKSKIAWKATQAGVEQIVEFAVDSYVPGAGKIVAAVYGKILEILVEELEKDINAYNKYSRMAGRAKEFLLGGDFDGAIRELDSMVALAPDLAWPYYRRSLAYLLKSVRAEPAYDHESLVRADADMAEARRLKPGSKEIGFASGLICFALLRRSDRDLADRKHVDRAIRDIGLVARRFGIAGSGLEHLDSLGLGGEANLRRFRCMWFIDKDRYDEAIAEADFLLKIYKFDGSAFFYRGLSYLLKGDFERGIAELTKAQRLAPESSEIRDLLAEARRERGPGTSEETSEESPDATIARATGLLGRDPIHVDSYVKRGWAYSQKRNHDRAIEDLKKARELKPDDPHIRKLLGTVYAMRAVGHSDYDRSITDLREAGRLDSENSLYRSGLADALVARAGARLDDPENKDVKDCDGPIADLTEVLRLGHGQPDAVRGRLGRAYLLRGGRKVLAARIAAQFTPRRGFLDTVRDRWRKSGKRGCDIMLEGGMADLDQAVAIDPRMRDQVEELKRLSNKF